jgi:hypothetical protein
MKEVLLTLAADPPHPRAGQEFTVVARLDKRAKEPVTVVFEKHRVYVDTSGKHELCIIYKDYFADDGVPKPIEIKQGRRKGSTLVKVRADAQNPPCPDKESSPPMPVAFPDRLMLTAFVKNSQSTEIGREHLVVTIREPKKTTQEPSAGGS